jgi:hypothetical protein
VNILITGACIAHGGGRRCQHDGCLKSALGDTEHCVAHGGGRRCQKEGCPRQLRQVAHRTASRMGAAGAASWRAAPRQSLELPAVCTARYVSSASSPTMRRTVHSNSVARPRRPKPRVGSRTDGGGWRVRGHPQASDRTYNREPAVAEKINLTASSFQSTTTNVPLRPHPAQGPSPLLAHRGVPHTPPATLRGPFAWLTREGPNSISLTDAFNGGGVWVLSAPRRGWVAVPILPRTSSIRIPSLGTQGFAAAVLELTLLWCGRAMKRAGRFERGAAVQRGGAECVCRKGASASHRQLRVCPL